MTPEREEALKPCPFCGAADILVLKATRIMGGYVQCQSCKADGPLKDTTEAAGAAWNIRPVEAELQERDKAVKVIDIEDGKNFYGIPTPNFIGKCPSCGARLTSFNAFCHECGKELEWQ